MSNTTHPRIAKQNRIIRILSGLMKAIIKILSRRSFHEIKYQYHNNLHLPIQKRMYCILKINRQQIFIQLMKNNMYHISSS
mmetsp:Transcript_23659/g.30682  ORF Transcript_23659/g.30682 Transcript_23659/m.30682 type:complete len:81 (-) Transcript_23659:53-295(-)